MRPAGLCQSRASPHACLRQFRLGNLPVDDSAQLLQRLLLNLSDPLLAEPEFPTNLFQCVWVLVGEKPEARDHDLPLSLGKFADGCSALGLLDT